MSNYLKSECYRIFHGKEIYQFCGLLCALVLAANVLLRAMALADGGFPYATVHFSLSNLLGGLGILFLCGGLLSLVLFSGDFKDGTLKNALAHGLSRRKLFFGRCLLVASLGLLVMLVVLAVYIGSAVVLLEGPALDMVLALLAGVAVALPSVLAASVLAVALFCVFRERFNALLVWGLLVFALPALLAALGAWVQPIGALSLWIPSVFFPDGTSVNMSGIHALPWDSALGLAKCLAAGFFWTAVSLGCGVAASRRIEL